MSVRRPAYLFRIDDVCDQMAAAEPLQRMLKVFRRHRVVPLLAVIPCNLDKSLTSQESRFRLEELGSALASNSVAIGLHGCHHRHEYSRACIWRLNDRSEFAGVPEPIQYDRITLGLHEIRQRLGVTPDFFVAPSHSYDRTTLRVLQQVGLAVSDGIALFPFVLDRVLHIPAQLWSTKARRDGLWTVIIHPQLIDDSFIAGLDDFLARNRPLVADFTMAALEPFFAKPWTAAMELRSGWFRRWFYLRLHLYHLVHWLRALAAGQTSTPTAGQAQP